MNENHLETNEEDLDNDEILYRSLLTPMNQIIPNLFLGNLEAATNKDLLKKNKITHILQVCPHKKTFKVVYKIILFRNLNIWYLIL
jgi:hypothetical protein